jgi:tetratricopeptide (TPR) repeat protein
MLTRLLLAIGMAIAMPCLTQAHPADAILAAADGNLRGERLQEARTAYQAAIDAYRPDARDVEARRSLVMALAGLGKTLTELSRYQEAKQPFAEAPSIAGQRESFLDAEVKWVSVLDGIRALEHGDYEIARQRCALDNLQSSQDGSSIKRALDSLVLYCAGELDAQLLGMKSNAADLFEAALVKSTGETGLLTALDRIRILGAVAQVRAKRQQWAGVEAAINAGNDLCKLEGGGNSACAAYFALALAGVNIVIGKHSEAAPLLDRAEAITYTKFGSSHLLSMLINYARAESLNSQRKDFGRAESLANAALANGRSVLLRNNLLFGMAHDQLALAFIGQEKWREAEQHELFSLDIREAVVGTNHPSLVAPLGNLAQLHRELAKLLREPERLAKARHYEQRIIEITGRN